MIENKRLPSIVLRYCFILLRQLLIREGDEALTPEIRRTVTGRLVAAASGDHRSAEQAILLFAELADYHKLEIKSFLTDENRPGLLRNYRRYAPKNISQKTLDKLEQELQPAGGTQLKR